jgi:hypothetical protein
MAAICLGSVVLADGQAIYMIVGVVLRLGAVGVVHTISVVIARLAGGVVRKDVGYVKQDASGIHSILTHLCIEALRFG